MLALLKLYCNKNLYPIQAHHPFPACAGNWFWGLSPELHAMWTRISHVDPIKDHKQLKSRFWGKHVLLWPGGVEVGMGVWSCGLLGQSFDGILAAMIAPNFIPFQRSTLSVLTQSSFKGFNRWPKRTGCLQTWAFCKQSFPHRRINIEDECASSMAILCSNICFWHFLFFDCGCL